ADDGENLNIAAIIAQQLQTILPQIVTQVTNNVNNANANDGNGNGGCSYKGFLSCNPQDYNGKGGAVALTRWIEKMESVIENNGCADNQKVKYAAKMDPNCRSQADDGENLNIAAIIAQQLQTILPQIVTQVTNNVNNANANDGNGNGGCSYKGFLSCNPQDYNGKGGAVALTRWIEKMESVIENNGCADNQKVKYAASSFINKALTWWNT
nr:reverse transcriptase domain-containing protein [Tanacetum cinerariifolium]